MMQLMTNLYHPSQKTRFAEMMNDFYYHHQVNLGDWVYIFFSEIANIEFQNSSLLTKEHVSLIARQETTYGIQK